MNKTKIVFGIGIVLAVLSVLTAPVAAQDYNIFHLVPEDSSCDGTGCTTTVWVNVNTSYSGINGVQASIIFDPDVVNVTLVEKGTDPAWYMWEWQIYNKYGYTYVYIKGSDVMGDFGPGELEIGKMTLHCEAAGMSSLHFADASEVTANDQTMIVNPVNTSGIWPITTEDGTFTCIGPEETFNKPLVAGWNLISLPLTATDMTVSSVIDTSLSGSYDELYKYDASANNFVSLTLGDTMANGVGYFINMTTEDTWTYSGTAYSAMNEGYSDGLNMIGWLSCTKDISTTGLDDPAKTYYISRWNADTQEYETYNPVAPSDFNDFTQMVRGEGYFISMKTSDTLSESC